MRISFIAKSILLIALSPINSSINYCEAQLNTAQKHQDPPVYIDNGKTIDSLEKVYNSEGIEYDHWDIDNSDSCLNIGFINSDKVPSFKDVNETVRKYKAIASSIKKALANPGNYNSYNIIFIKKEKGIGGDVRIHSAGMQLKNKELEN